MKTESLFKKSVLAASIAVITACSGGSDSSTSNNDGTTVGVVTGFGSVYVNGVEYETDTATIDIDGVSSVETSLGVGDVVVLKGTVNADGTTGTATAVTCTDELEGYVLDIAGLGTDGIGSMNVMGQTVMITSDTVFDSDIAGKLTVNDLVVTDIVEVSGFPDGTGSILATRIETKDAAEDIEVKGIVSMLDTGAFTFKLGDLTVDYSTASEVESGLADGLYVEVKTDTTLSGDIDAGFVMVASKVEIEEDGDLDIEGDEGDEIEVQGVVSDVTETSFRFNGILVEFASLETDDDFDLTTLVDGMMITVEGYIDANGDFVVEEIEEDHGSELEVEGTVSAKDETSVTVTLADGSTQVFTVNNDTRMIDEQDEGVTPLHYFSLADVAIGDFVEVEYYVDDASGDNIATELEREDAPSNS